MGILLSIPVNLAIIVFGLLAFIYTLAGICYFVAWVLELPLEFRMRRLEKEIDAHAKDTAAFNARMAALHADFEEIANQRPVEIRDC